MMWSSKALCLALFLLAGSATGKKSRGVSKDGPLIRCELCPLVAEASFPADGDVSNEMAVLDVVEAVCDPSTKEGRWMRSLDLVERGNRLRIEKVDGVSRCEVECRTVALACVDIVDTAGATDIADLIYGGASTAELEQWLCGGQTGGSSRACKAKAPPKIWEGRPKGPPFVPVPEKELQMEDLMASLPKGMSMATRDSLMGNVDEDSEDSPASPSPATSEAVETVPGERSARPRLTERVAKAGSTVASRIRDSLGGSRDGSGSTEL